jgi:hypothetical protein
LGSLVSHGVDLSLYKCAPRISAHHSQTRGHDEVIDN